MKLVMDDKEFWIGLAIIIILSWSIVVAIATSSIIYGAISLVLISLVIAISCFIINKFMNKN